jgi:hypothetical protein
MQVNPNPSGLCQCGCGMQTNLRGENSSKEPKAKCSICKQPVYENIDPVKIITCSLCVYKLLHASNEVKIQAKEAFLQRDDLEAARSIESFIIPEGGNDIATFKTSCLKRGSNRLVHRIKWGLKDSSDPNCKK